MSIDWTPLADLIETHDRFLVTTHVRPDGDALGSEVGMAGLLRQKGKDVRVVNASPTPPRYDFLDPDGTLFEHFGHGRSARGAGGSRGRGDPRPLGVEPARRHGRIHPRLPGTKGGHRPPRQPGRPGGDLPEGYVGRGDRDPGPAGRPRPGGDAHAGGGDRPADGDRDGHRLVPALEHEAEHDAGRGRADRGRRRDRRDLPAALRAEYAGPAQADGRDARRPEDRPGRADRLRHGHPRRPACAPARSRRTPRTWSTSPSACAAWRSACCSSSRPAAA